jgi:periplasmic protein CpxP/Spy
MKGIKSIVVFGVLVYILAGWVGAYALDSATGPSGKGHGRHGGGFLKVLEQLNLTESQKQDIAGILKQNREQARQLRSEMFAARKLEVEAITGSTFDEGAVRGAAQQAAHAEEQLAVMRAQAFSEIRKLLTQEQLETLQKIKANFGSKMQQRMERRMSSVDRWIDQSTGQ